MTARRPALAVAVGRGALLAAGYLAVTLWLSYAVWGPYDGVEHDPAWASDDRLWPALLVLHAAVGAALGLRAFVLPLAWVVLSVPAGGYDTPVWVAIAFGLPFFWLPATAAGVLARQVAGRSARRPA